MFVQVYYSLWFCTYIRAEIANKYLVNLILAFSFCEKYISNQEFLYFISSKYLVNLILAFSFHEKYISDQEFLYLICLGRNFKVHIYVVSARDPF